VRTYFRQASGFEDVRAELRTPITSLADPLWAVWARRAARM
jgi:hypothetical protein